MKTIDADLLDCRDRANPYVEHRVELSRPDVAKVLRRPDHFTNWRPGTVAPVGSLSVGANGELKITPTSAALANFAGEQSSYDLNGENLSRRLKGVTFTVDPAFVRGVLKTFTARIQRVANGLGYYYPLDFNLQIYRITRTPGAIEKVVGGQIQSTAFTQYAFTPLLSSPAIVKSSQIVYDGAQKATLTFDLSAYALSLENSPPDASRPDYAGELPAYHFVLSPINNPKGTGYFKWLVDTASARAVANVGTFNRVFWARESDDAQWAPQSFADVPACSVNVENYIATAAAQYDIDLGAVPDTASGSVGRIVFERSLPYGSAATLELSSDAGASWAVVKHGDVIAVVQQTYRLRLTLNSGAAGRSSPGIRAMGIEYRIPVDVSVESSISFPTHELAVPWCVAAIPEGKLRVIRDGVRDYYDKASTLGATASPTKLEADIYLASRHPSITRDKWLLLERLSVTNRVPSPTSEEFSLLSYAQRLKRNVPEKRESISTIHVVQAGSTAAQLVVAPALPGATVGGNEFDGQHYYIRVPSTSKTTFVNGYTHEIAGNTGVDKLDFAPALPDTLNVGDIIEVHSGIFVTDPIVYQDADPYDVWWDLITNRGAVPSERVGLGSLPRGGLPPKVTDIAPGDAATQAKLKITCAIRDEESLDELIDQVSFILRGATVEISGQVCFVQIYPIRDATGTITIPLPATARTWDARDIIAPQTSPGLENRATMVSTTYGVNNAATNKDAYPERLTVGVDPDAVSWLTQQNLETVGTSSVPEKVARWLWNSADSGLYLASDLTGTVVRSCSTGTRVFPFSVTDAAEEITAGDVVVLVTDQYTDYDPTTGTEIRGWNAIKGVIVRAGGGGRQFAMFVLGLADNVTQVKGQLEGVPDGTGEPPSAPSISADFDATGHPTVSVFAGAGTASAKLAVDTAAPPDDAAVEATTAIDADQFSVSYPAVIVPPGGAFYVSLIEYTRLDGGGVRSTTWTIGFQRGVGDTASPPYAEFQPQSESRTNLTTKLTGSLGIGDTGPLEYRWRTDYDGATGAWSAWSAFPLGGGTYATLSITKDHFFTKEIVAQVRDSSAVPIESAPIAITVNSQNDALDLGTGRLRHGEPMDVGATPFGYSYDTAVGVVETAAMSFTNGSMLDGSRRIANVYRGAVTEPVGNLFKRSSDTAADVVEDTARSFTAPSMLDASRRITSVYRSTVIEGVGNLFKRASDTAADVIETSGLGFTLPSSNATPMLDASRRIVNVYRATTTEPVGNLFKRASDTAADVNTTAGRTFVDPALVNGSFQVTAVRRLGVNEPVDNLLKVGDTITSAMLPATGSFATRLGVGGAADASYALRVYGKAFVGSASADRPLTMQAATGNLLWTTYDGAGTEQWGVYHSASGTTLNFYNVQTGQAPLSMFAGTGGALGGAWTVSTSLDTPSLKISGTERMTDISGHTALKNALGEIVWYSPRSGLKNHYWQGDAHNFRDLAASVIWATISSAGLQLFTGMGSGAKIDFYQSATYRGTVYGDSGGVYLVASDGADRLRAHTTGGTFYGAWYTEGSGNAIGWTDRTTSMQWVWYATGEYARLNNGTYGDILKAYKTGEVWEIHSAASYVQIAFYRGTSTNAGYIIGDSSGFGLYDSAGATRVLMTTSGGSVYGQVWAHRSDNTSNGYWRWHDSAGSIKSYVGWDSNGGLLADSAGTTRLGWTTSGGKHFGAWDFDTLPTVTQSGIPTRTLRPIIYSGSAPTTSDYAPDGTLWLKT